MALGSLAIWTAVPVVWFWLTRDLQSGAARYLIVIICCPITMLGGAALLYRVETVYARVSGVGSQDPTHSAWLHSISDERRSHLSLLETFLVASALIALVALVGWWVFLADNPNPSGPLQPV